MKTENWAIVASLLAGVALVGFFAAPSLLRGPPRDQETLCPKTGPVGQTLILVDKSDPWSEVQAGRLKALVKQVGDELPADRMLYLEGLGTAPKESDTVMVGGQALIIMAVADIVGAGQFFSTVARNA